MATSHLGRPARYGLAVALGLLLTIGLCEVAGWPFLRAPLQQRLERQLAREVMLAEPFRLRLIGSVRLQSGRFAIGPPEWAQGAIRRPLLQAEGVSLQLPWSTLLAAGRPGRPLHLHALEVQRLEAWVHRNAEGRANWQFAPTSVEDRQAPVQTPRFERLLVHNGRIDALDQVLALELHAAVRTDEGSRAGPDEHGLRIEARGQWRRRPFTVQMASPGMLPLLASEGTAQPVAVQLQARAGGSRLSFDGSVRDVLHLSGMDGKASLSGPSLAAVGDMLGLTLPTTSAFEARGHLAREGSRWAVELERLDVGRSRLGGHFNYDRAPVPPRLSGELHGQRLMLADLAPAFGARAGPQAPPAAPEGRVLPAREFDIPSLLAMDADVRLELQEVRLGSLFAEPLKPLHGLLRLQKGVLELDDLLARTALGELRGRLSIDARDSPPHWSSELHWKGIRLERWLSPRNLFSAQAQQGEQARSYVSGLFEGQARLQGRGRSTAALLGTLDGNAAGWVRNGQISHLLMEALGLDIAQGLGLVLRGDKPLPLHCAVVQLQARNGELRPEVAVLDTPDTTVLIGGNVSLRHETLALKLTARPKDVSPLTLRSPLYLEGSFAQPAVRPDMSAIGGKVLAAAALAVVNPLAALLPLVDPGNGDEGSGCRRAIQQLAKKPEGRPGGAVDAQDRPAPRSQPEGAR